MSSGTQVELDWTGMDAAQGGATAAPPSGTNGTGSGTGAFLTDEEILGIEPVGGTKTSHRDVIPSARTEDSRRGEARNPSSFDGTGNPGAQRDSSGKNSPQNDSVAGPASPHNHSAGESATTNAMPEWMLAAAGDPKHGAEAQRLWQEHQAFRAAFSSPDEARAIKELFPGGAQEVLALRQTAQDADSLKQSAQAIDRIDAALFSGNTQAQSEVVAELARANPAAFRSLFAEATKVLAGLGLTQPVNQPPTLRENREGWGTQVNPNASQNSSTPARTSSVTNHESRVTDHVFDPAAYTAFERSTNEAVARDVRAAVSDTLARVLPDGVADGAARRIGDDIFNELHRTLAADRSLSEHVAAVLREHRFGSAEQQRVASLLAGRAKQLVPGIARRVVGEWTSSVLGASRTKAARQAAAGSRVDIAAPGGSLDSMPLRPMSSREIHYASMSDEDILSM